MKIQRILDGLEPLDSDFRYLEQRKSEGPARRIKATRAKRTTTIFSSKKMGQTVPTESILEFYVALNLELSSSVVGFWEQPPTVKVSKTRKNGIAYTGEHTPDFLALLANDALVAIEVKYAEEILKKLGKIECPFMETDEAV